MLTETYAGNGSVTTFIVDPVGDASRLRIVTSWESRPGLRGFFERSHRAAGAAAAVPARARPHSALGAAARAVTLRARWGRDSAITGSLDEDLDPVEESRQTKLERVARVADALVEVGRGNADAGSEREQAGIEDLVQMGRHV